MQYQINITETRISANVFFEANSKEEAKKMASEYYNNNYVETDLIDVKYEVTEEIPNFIDDEEKMFDFINISKEDFLKSYSYVTEKEYDNTKDMRGLIP